MSGKAKTAARGLDTKPGIAAQMRKDGRTTPVKVTRVLEFRRNAKGNLVPKMRFERSEA